jgi:hypothetical protein
MAAALCKKQELTRSAQCFLDLAATVEPAPTIVRHEHAVFCVYLREDLVSGRGGIHTLGLDVDQFKRLSIDSICGIFRLIRVYGNLLEYEMDERNDGY